MLGYRRLHHLCALLIDLKSEICVAMNNMDPFKAFLLLVGKVPGAPAQILLQCRDQILNRACAKQI
ncbi:MAG TPA: hypothetical protein DG761_04525 [Gammaproteobacteria bacterium]|nr:hypothetical protein [Gammaproteobacteria bacterium]